MTLLLFISVCQVILTTELVHSSSDTVTDSAVTESMKGTTKDSRRQQKGKVDAVDETGHSVAMENNVIVTTPADRDATTINRKPSKIIFKDYYMDSVCYLLITLIYALCLVNINKLEALLFSRCALRAGIVRTCRTDGFACRSGSTISH